MSLPGNAYNCILAWYHQQHGSVPPPGSFRIASDGGGLQIKDWKLADAIPSDAVLAALEPTADAYVAANIRGDTDQWSKELRMVLKLIFTLWKIVNPALTAQQFKTQVKNLWDNL